MTWDEPRTSTPPENMPIPADSDVTENTWALLAGLRFLLALIVMADHISYMARGVSPLLVLANFGGMGAVAAFLVISGFSIAHSVELSPKGFYGRRFDRIVPVHVACFLLACVPYIIWGNNFAFQGGTPGMAKLLGSFFLASTFTGNLNTYAPAWSLSVEVICYAFAPLLLTLKSRRLAWILGVSAFSFLVHRYFMDSDIGLSSHGLTLLIMPWLWLAGFLYYRHRNSNTAGLLLIVVIGTVLALGNSRIDFIQDTPFVLVACAMIWKPAIPRKWMKPFNVLGDLSYPLYLVHFPIIALLSGVNCENPSIMAAAALVAAIIVLVAIDYPMRKYARWRNKRGKPSELQIPV